MKYLAAYLFSILLLSSVFAQNSNNMIVLSNYNNTTLRGVDGGDIWNDCTAWHNSANGKEYVIAGSTDSIYVWDISNDGLIKLLDVESGASSYVSNRDYVTYQHYVYCVSDNGSGVGALQIFDLKYLPDSLHKVYHSSEFGYFTHTVFLDSLSKRLYMCSNTTKNGLSAMDVLSIENPEQPTYIGSLQVPKDINQNPIFRRVHEMYARHDTVYCSCEEAGLYIFDLSDLNNQKLLGSITSYPFKGYNHSSWLDESGKYINFTDENEGMAVKIFDIHDFANPRLVSTFNSNPQCMPHNTFWIGNLIYSSAYHDGVVIWEVSDKSNPREIAYYDTHPQNPEVYGGYKGCWGVFPFLPSGRIVASDLRSGIWVFRMDTTLNSISKMNEKERFQIYPNPIHEKLIIDGVFTENTNVEIFDMEQRLVCSRTIHSGTHSIEIPTLDWPQGLYIAQLKSSHSNFVQKILR